MTDTTNPFEPPKASLETTVTAPEAAPPLWNPDVAGAWSIFLTPIFGSAIVRKNWQALGDEQKARTGTVWLSVSIAVLVAALFAGMFGVTVGRFISLFYLIVWYFAWQKPQTTYIKERWGKEYPHKGWGMPLMIAIGAILGLYVLLVLVIFAWGSAARAS